MSKSWPDFTLLVEHKGLLPVVGKEFPVISCLSETRQSIKVKAIHVLRWNNEGDLVVEIDGVKVKERDNNA